MQMYPTSRGAENRFKFSSLRDLQKRDAPVLNIVGEPARCILKKVDCDLPLGGAGLQDCWF